MINLKKSLVAVLLFSSVVLSLFGAPSGSTGDKNSAGSVAESSIMLSDGEKSTDSDSVGVPVKKGSSGISVFIRMLVVLIIVVALIYFVFYFVKKKTNYVKNDDEYLRRAAYINIAPGKTVEVITLIDKAYLIGVTDERITLLGEIKDDELIKAMNISADKKSNTKKPTTFSDVLDNFLVRGNKQKSVFDESASKLNVEPVFGDEEDKE